MAVYPRACQRQAITAGGTAIVWPNGARWVKLPSVARVKKVHVVQSCHLDIGFAGTAVDIINKYIGPGGYFETAPLLSQALRDRGGEESYKFLTHSWLVGLYVDCRASFPHLPLDGLECPTPARLSAFDAAVRRGDIVWYSRRGARRSAAQHGTAQRRAAPHTTSPAEPAARCGLPSLRPRRA